MRDPPDGWTEELRANRETKDEFFAEHAQSPIPPEYRDEFDGLAYFEPDPGYRVEATVSAPDDAEVIDLDTSDGRAIRYERVVTFSFDLDGERRTLHGFRRPDDDSAGAFVPFRDKTTGQETYEQGRYLDLEPDRPFEDGDEVTLDFNLAYNPFCAYNETFSCTLPPEANWLETTVEAGERRPTFLE